MQLVVTYAMKAGFTGGIVIDFPNSTRAKKYTHAPRFVADGLRVFLCLFAGTAGVLPRAKTDHDEQEHGAGYGSMTVMLLRSPQVHRCRSISKAAWQASCCEESGMDHAEKGTQKEASAVGSIDLDGLC